MNLSRNDSGQLNEEAQQLIDIIDINPSNEKYAKCKSVLKEKYNIDYVEPSIRYKKENDLLEKYFGIKKVKTNKGLDVSIHLFKTPNLDKSITLEVFDDSLNNIARAGVGIDLQSKTIRVGGVMVNDNMRRKGVYSSIINEIEKISKENNLKMQETGRSQDAQNFWKSRNNPDIRYKDGGNTTQDFWAGKKSGEWYSKKLRIDQLRIGKEFLLARRNFKLQKSKVDEQQKPVWNWEHRDSVYDEKGMAIGYDWYNDITDDVLLLSDLYNEFIELREEKKKLVNSNKEELENIGYKDWIYKDYLINKRVKCDTHDSEGVLEGLGSNESIIAIGTKSYCKEIQNNEAKEEYEYYINPSKTEKGLYVLREVWLGYYLKSGGNINDFTYEIGGL
jgi:hypothetical protein